MSAWDQPPAPGDVATSHATPDPSFGAPPPDPSFGAPPVGALIEAPRAQTVSAPRSRRNRWVAALLALLLGGFGAQRFYIGQRKMGAAVLGLLLLGCVVPPFLLVVMGWSLVDAVRFAAMSDADFDERYNRG